jgi:hypothetical protein
MNKWTHEWHVNKWVNEKMGTEINGMRINVHVNKWVQEYMGTGRNGYMNKLAHEQMGT